MEQGPTEQHKIELARKMNQPIPQRILNKPQLMLGLSFYYVAFQELSTDRSSGMGEGPIRWSAVDAYARRYDLVGEEFERFRRLITAMDAVYLDYRRKQYERQQRGKG